MRDLFLKMAYNGGVVDPENLLLASWGRAQQRDCFELIKKY